MCRISSLPDGCNRMDEPWSRSHINGDEDEEYGGPCHYVYHETITKENFMFFFEDEIEEQQRFDEFIEDYFDDSIKLQEGGNEMIRQNIPQVPSEDKIEQNVISPSRELPVDFALENYYINFSNCNILFEGEPKGIDI